jgi:hypothetical protein
MSPLFFGVRKSIIELMAEIIEMPKTGSAPEREPDCPEKLFFEFPDMAARARAMEVINQFRKEHREIFAGEQSYKVDSGRPQQGLELAFGSTMPERAQQILDRLHAEGITLNSVGEAEEQVYRIAA